MEELEKGEHRLRRETGHTADDVALERGRITIITAKHLPESAAQLFKVE